MAAGVRPQDQFFWALLVAVGLGVVGWAGWSWLVPAQPDWILVSVSVDQDTPEVLSKYAAAHGADPERWLFLTADRKTIDDWIEPSFQSRPQRNPQAEPGLRVAHSNRLFLIDEAGYVRGSYLAVEEVVDNEEQPTGTFRPDRGELQRLRRDALALSRGHSVSSVWPAAPVEDFEFTNADGRKVTRQDLAGRIWVAGFIFTQCSMSCPQITQAMAGLQDRRLAMLPTVNAVLNGTSAVLLIVGYVLIRRRRIAAHVACMVGAVLVSTLFLVSYLYYHYHHGATSFAGEGWIRPVYFSVLISHTVLAVAVVPLVLWTLYRAARGQFAKHVRIARWTLPIWLYVSVTGVLVYLMLYHWYAS